MKKLLIITGVAVVLTASICTVALAAFQSEPKTTVYRGEEWHFDIEDKKYPHIIITPKDRKEPQVYGNGFVGKVETEEKKYDIVLLND